MPMNARYDQTSLAVHATLAASMVVCARSDQISMAGRARMTWG